MDALDIIVNLSGLVIFIVWVASMISWFRSGVRIPSHIHVLALVLSSLSVGCLIGLALAGMATITMAFLFILLPAFLSYVGWFWLFGPDQNRA